MIRRPAAAALLVVAGLAAGCGAGEGDDGACVGTLRWNGTTYYEFGMTGRGAPAGAGAVGTASVPPCDDEQPSSGDAGATPVRVVRLAGISPRIAIAREGDRDTAYLAEGFLPELREHPLHAATRIGEVRPADCEEPIEVTGRVTATRTAIRRTQVAIDGGEPEGVAFEGDATIQGFRRAGQPYLAPGDAVTMRGRYCRPSGPGPDPRMLVVGHVRPA